MQAYEHIEDFRDQKLLKYTTAPDCYGLERRYAGLIPLDDLVSFVVIMFLLIELLNS